MREKTLTLEVGEEYVVVRVTRGGVPIAEHTLHAPCAHDGSLAYLKGGPGVTSDEPLDVRGSS